MEEARGRRKKKEHGEEDKGLVMVCLDTDVVIDFLHGERGVVAEIGKYAARGPVSITSITLYELFRGADEQQLQAVFDFVSGSGIYGFEDREATEASKMYKRLKREGKMIKENDILIAGTVTANNELLITEDRDFERVLSNESLVVLDVRT